jgi:hypothetical protein
MVDSAFIAMCSRRVAHIQCISMYPGLTSTLFNGIFASAICAPGLWEDDGCIEYEYLREVLEITEDTAENIFLATNKVRKGV